MLVLILKRSTYNWMSWTWNCTTRIWTWNFRSDTNSQMPQINCSKQVTQITISWCNGNAGWHIVRKNLSVRKLERQNKILLILCWVPYRSETMALWKNFCNTVTFILHLAWVVVSLSAPMRTLNLSYLFQ